MGSARIFLLAFLISSSAWAETLTDEFTSITSNDTVLNSDPSASLVWNTALGYLHPTLFITGVMDQFAVAVPDQNFSVGNGSHGPFNNTTYDNFGTVNGTTIEINTDSYPE